MTIFKALLTFGLLLTSTLSIQADDYALLDTYPLLNDMNMVRKEQQLLQSISQLMCEQKHYNRSRLIEQKKLFTAILNGLSKGDSNLGLHGTELPYLKHKINTIALVWFQEKTIIDSAFNNKMYEKDALATIDRVSKNLEVLNTLYKQSYARYKKNSIMKSVVQSYMKTTLQVKPKYAMNTIR